MIKVWYRSIFHFLVHVLGLGRLIREEGRVCSSVYCGPVCVATALRLPYPRQVTAFLRSNLEEMSSVSFLV